MEFPEAALLMFTSESGNICIKTENRKEIEDGFQKSKSWQDNFRCLRSQKFFFCKSIKFLIELFQKFPLSFVFYGSFKITNNITFTLFWHHLPHIFFPVPSTTRLALCLSLLWHPVRVWNVMSTLLHSHRCPVENCHLWNLRHVMAWTATKMGDNKSKKRSHLPPSARVSFARFHRAWHDCLSCWRRSRWCLCLCFYCCCSFGSALCKCFHWGFHCRPKRVGDSLSTVMPHATLIPNRRRSMDFLLWSLIGLELST